MIKMDKNLSPNQKISSQLAFLLIIFLSFAAAWYTINVGQEIVDNARASETFNVGKKIDKNLGGKTVPNAENISK